MTVPVGHARHQFPFNRCNLLWTQKRVTLFISRGLSCAPWLWAAKVCTEPARWLLLEQKAQQGTAFKFLGTQPFFGCCMQMHLRFPFPPAHSVTPSFCCGAGDCHFAVLLSSDKMEALEESVTTTACAF